MSEQKKELLPNSILKPGEYFSRRSYFKILEEKKSGFLVENDEGEKWTISPEIIQSQCRSASNVTETKEVTITEMQNILSTAHGDIFTVTFTKQKTKEDVVEILKSVKDTDLKDSKTLTSLAKDILSAGKERKIIGRLVSTETNLGRFTVIDLEINEPRLVDSRTVKSIILRNVLYKVK